MTSSLCLWSWLRSQFKMEFLICPFFVLSLIVLVFTKSPVPVIFVELGTCIVYVCAEIVKIKKDEKWRNTKKINSL